MDPSEPAAYKAKRAVPDNIIIPSPNAFKTLFEAKHFYPYFAQENSMEASKARSRQQELDASLDETKGTSGATQPPLALSISPNGYKRNLRMVKY